MKRTALSLLFGLALPLLLAACGSNDPLPPTGVDSPAPPESAPAQIMELASKTIVSGGTGPVEKKTDGAATCKDGVTRTVTLQDPAGSGDYRFDPGELAFAKGDCVTFTVKSENEFHTFTVEGLDIDVSVDGGNTETFAFTFDKPGEYKLICRPHEFRGMVGTITVSK